MGKPQVAGVYEKILECAKKEFLEKGFEGASLRAIAQNAGTSTNSIYVRFQDKVGVFEALVQPAADGLKELIRTRQNAFGAMSPQDQSAQVMEYSDQHFPDILAYIYDHFTEFKLLVSCSYGTPYANFIHDLSTIDAECYRNYIEATGNDALTSGRASENLLHLLSSGFYSSLLELVVHNISREDAAKDMARLRKFYAIGWEHILHP